MLRYVMYSHFHPNIISLPSHHSTSHSTALLHLLCLASMLEKTKISVLIDIISTISPFKYYCHHHHHHAYNVIIAINIMLMLIIIIIIMLMVAIRREKLACPYQRIFALI